MFHTKEQRRQGSLRFVLVKLYAFIKVEESFAVATDSYGSAPPMQMNSNTAAGNQKHLTY
jgi:hypothetical protein